MLDSLTRNWCIAAIRGTLATILGIVEFVWPGITFEALVLLFGLYASIDGVLVLAFGVTAAREASSGGHSSSGASLASPHQPA